MKFAPPIEALRPFKDFQYEADGFPFAALEPDHETYWITLLDYRSTRPVQVPAQFVGIDRRVADIKLIRQRSTGVAAGQTVTQASERAILEIVERDVVTRAWFSQRLVRVQPDDLLPETIPRGFCVDLLAALPSPAPVMLAFLSDESGLGALGYSCAPTAGMAAVHAVEEARLMYAYQRQSDRLCDRPELDCEWVDPTAVPPLSWSEVLTTYAPAIIDLTSREAQLVGLHVMGAWSSRAIDIPHAVECFPLARWEPDVHNIEAFRGLLTYLSIPGGPNG